jgi:NADH-quinone oxidoreductase subunit C
VITGSQIIEVAPDSWVQAAKDQHGQGLQALDYLTAVDRGGAVEVLAHLVSPGTGDEAMLRAVLPADAPHLASLVSVFPGADWHERETAEMFGIEFYGRIDTDPLLLRTPSERPPLRRDSPLPERVDTPWPGAEEKQRRRRRLPPGVREEWVDSDE